MSSAPQSQTPGLEDRHELIAFHLLRIASLLEKAEASAFVVVQGRAPKDMIGQIPRSVLESPTFEFSLMIVQRLLPEAAFPVQIVQDSSADDPLILRFAGLVPARNDHDCLAELTTDLDFLGSFHDMEASDTREVYVIGTAPLNVADRIATIHAPTPEAAMLKFAAVVYPGIAADQRGMLDIDLDGLAMRRLDTWVECDVEKLWVAAKNNLRLHVERASSPEPDFDF